MNIGVIGLGKLGSLHARIYAQIPAVKKVYIFDTDIEKARELIPFLLGKGEIVSSTKALLTLMPQAVSVATPTSTHYEIAKPFLKNKIHCLIEKPITNSLKEAKCLYAIAQKNKLVLLAGHVERFNSAYLTAKDILKNPLFIECHRLSQFPKRSLDIGVVLDLMIHDLDIVLDLVKDTPSKIDAVGVNVLSKKEDIANVRIRFKNGCVANITASRISQERIRKIRIFTQNSYASLDYAAQEIIMYKKTGGQITKKSLNIQKEQPLQQELAYFVNQVRRGRRPLLPDYAIDALSLALKIQKKIRIKHG